MKKFSTIGWREWVTLENTGSIKIKAKIDSGAKSSCLHAFNIKEFEINNQKYISYKLHPLQKNTGLVLERKSPLLEYRHVKDSGGKKTLRPVIKLKVTLGDFSWFSEITLVSRDQMGFRMLLGREALKNRFLIDCSSSFLHKKETKGGG